MKIYLRRGDQELKGQGEAGGKEGATLLGSAGSTSLSDHVFGWVVGEVCWAAEVGAGSSERRNKCSSFIIGAEVSFQIRNRKPESQLHIAGNRRLVSLQPWDLRFGLFQTGVGNKEMTPTPVVCARTK